MYADFNGKTLAVTRTEEGSPFQYQVLLGPLLKNSSFLIHFCEDQTVLDLTQNGLK